MKVKSGIAFLSLLLITATGALIGCKEVQSGNASAAGESMINQFADTCSSSVGDWSSVALQQTQSLLATLQELKSKNDAACAGLDSAILAAQNIQYQLDRMAHDPAVVAYRAAEERKLDLILAIQKESTSSSPDQKLLSVLRQELYATELDIVHWKAESSWSKKENRRDGIINGLGQLNQFVASLMSQGSLTGCLAAAPQMPLGVAASLLAIGGNFTTPIIGAGLSTLGSLMATTVSYVRNLPIDRMQLNLQNTQMQAALTCSLESMSNLYCKADTSYKFIEFALASYRRDQKSNDVWRGMDLLGRRVPILNDWLWRIVSGVDPSDAFAARRLNEVWQKQSKLREISNLVQGEVNKVRRLLEGATTPAERDLREKGGFKKIISYMYAPVDPMNGAVNPVSEVVSTATAICRLSANPQCVPPTTGAGGYVDTGAMIDQYGMAGGFSAFNARLDTLLEEIRHLVARELLDTINRDPNIFLAEAIEPSLDNWSPLQVMKEIENFNKDFANLLRTSPPNSMVGIERATSVADETAMILKEIHDNIVGAGKPEDVVQLVFDRLKLLDGNDFLNQRLNQIVRWELEMRIRNGQLPSKVSEDLIAAGIDLADQLERSGINVQRDADAIVGDIRNAQYISMQNLKHTTEFFSKTIGTLMAEMRRSSKEAGELSHQDPAMHRLAQLCILVLTTAPKWPENIDINLCKGTKLKSVYRNSGIELDFDRLRAKIVSSKPPAYKDKVCIYSNFLSAARLFKAGSMRAPPSSGTDKGLPPAIPPLKPFSARMAPPKEEAKLIPILDHSFQNLIWGSTSTRGIKESPKR